MALEDLAAQQEHTWHEWPLVIREGGIAALFQLVSDEKVLWHSYLMFDLISRIMIRVTLKSTPHKHRQHVLVLTGIARKQVRYNLAYWRGSS